MKTIWQKSKEYYKQLAESYAMSLRRIESELNIFYSLLDDINLREANKLLKGAELKDFKRKMRYLAEEEITELWRKSLITASERQRISRMQSLHIQISHELNSLSVQEIKGLESLSREIYKDAFYKKMFDVGKELGYIKAFNKVDFRKIELLNRKPWGPDNKNFSTRIWTRNNTVDRYLQTEIVQSVTLGEDPQKAINNIAKQFNKSKQQAGRLVMTETAYYSSVADEDVYRNLGVEEYQFISTLDDRTSDLCQEMDGKIFSISDYKINETAPPLHPYCRSTTIPHFSGNVKERIARDKDGKWIEVPGNMTYKEFTRTH